MHGSRALDVYRLLFLFCFLVLVCVYRFAPHNFPILLLKIIPLLLHTLLFFTFVTDFGQIVDRKGVRTRVWV